LVIAFGEELYQFFRPFISHPAPAPAKLSARADKSIPDAEYWFVHQGPLTLSIEKMALSFVALRHAGNSKRLPKSTAVDKRLEYYDASARSLIRLLAEEVSRRD
jgi:hypothetical protein